MPSIEVNEELKQITQFGENFEARFSPDGKKIVFVSRLRPQHSYGQIYEIQLDAQKEQRLTFQGAENFNPSYVRDGGWLLYSSATDESKENPPLLNSSAENSFVGPDRYKGAADIYLHNLSKFDVKRLTSAIGFEGDPFWFEKSERVVFTRKRGKNLYIYLLDVRRPNVILPHSKSPGLSNWQASQDGQTQIWIDWNKDYSKSNLKLKTPSGIQTILPDFDRIIKHPFYVEDLNLILFSMNHPDENSFNVFSINTDGTCLTQWTNNGFENLFPTLSPDHKFLAFSNNRKGSFQIYLKKWAQTPSCVSSTKAVQ